MQHRNIQVEGVNIHYVEAGAANHQDCMVFLHGFPEYWGTWQAQLAHFSHTHRVIAPDLPGYNLSDKPQDKGFYAVPNLIQFIGKFIQSVAPEQKVILVAHDWGGAIAWPLAAFLGELIDKLVILNAAHPSTFTREMIHNKIQRQKSEYIHDLIADNAVETLSKNNYQYLKDKIFTGMRQGTLSDAQRQTYLQVWAQTGAVEGMLQYYRGMPQLAPSTAKGSISDGPVVAPTQMKIPNIRINCPTLVLWGEQDQAFVKQNIDGLEEYVANLTVVRFAQASHWLQHEMPNEVNAEISLFLENSG